MPGLATAVLDGDILLVMDDHFDALLGLGFGGPAVAGGVTFVRGAPQSSSTMKQDSQITPRDE